MDKMKARFWREGKEISYTELTEVFGQIINEKVLHELDKEQIEELFVRTFDAAYKAIKEYLEVRNFKIITQNQAILTAHQIKLIEDKELWGEALRRRDLIVNDYELYEASYKEDMMTFIKEAYYPAMREMQNKIA